MPHRQIAGTDVTYELVLFDEDGAERPEADGMRLSTNVIARAADGVTDVFLLSHGWKGDVPAAIRQYDSWIGAMAAQRHDRAAIRAREPDFRALVVAVHWPSLPWGVEDAGAALLGPESEADAVDTEDALTSAALVDRYAERLRDTSVTRGALQRILDAAEDPQTVEDLQRGELQPEVLAAYESLFDEAGLGLAGAVGPPGLDQSGFDPVTTIAKWGDPQAAGADPESLTLGWGDGLAEGLAVVRKALLGPVRQLSFWTMKKRARTVGESGVHDLLSAIQQAAPRARTHLMGHSFGCIVASSAIAGPRGHEGPQGSGLPRPVDAVVLVQGAMSLWSFARSTPFPPFHEGFFRGMLESPARVGGPLVTTRSSFDTAVARYYPLGARIGDDVLLSEDLPEFGGIGVFGIQGADALDMLALPATGDYDLAPGLVCNVDASSVICNGDGASGAHNDISHPEIAHLVWQAAAATIPR